MIHTIQATKIFQKNLEAFNKVDSGVICNQGSSRSGKTYNIMIMLIMLCLQKKNTSISVVSISIPHLKKGALKDFLEIMQLCELFKDNQYHGTDRVYSFENGSKIEFFSADNSQKLRGSRRQILFINEANLLNKAKFTQLAIRTSQKIILDYNPADYSNYVYDIADNESNTFIKSTYLDNPFLSEAQIEFIENMNPDKSPFGDINTWRVFGLGERGLNNLLIYPKIKFFKKMPNIENDRKDVFYGLDFGFQDPSVLLKVTKIKEIYYVEELIYKRGLTNSVLVKEIEKLNISKNSPIYCDSAEPDRIKEINSAGFYATKSDKSVKSGIDKLKNLQIFIQEDGTNTCADFRNYKYKTTKDEEVLDEPSHFFSHAPDALRYAIHTHDKRNNTILI